MWPTARHGDVLVVERGIQVALGDVVVVRLPRTGQLVAHRLMERSGALLRCANARGVFDPYVHELHVFGRVVGIERDGEVRAVGHGDRFTRALARSSRVGALAARIVARLSRSPV